MKRTFTRDELEELGLPDSDHTVHTEQIDERRWYSIHELIFRVEDDGPLWRVSYYEPLTELQEHDTWNDAETIEAVQVEPYEATVTKYRPVAEPKDAPIAAGAPIIPTWPTQPISY